jgi:hypothetical protein
VSEAQAALDAARERHRARTSVRRAAAVVGGWVALLLGAAVVVPLPELGFPLLLVGLRVLALRYDWAARAYLPVAGLWARLRALPLAAKIAIGVAGIAIVAGIVWWLA